MYTFFFGPLCSCEDQKTWNKCEDYFRRPCLGDWTALWRSDSIISLCVSAETQTWSLSAEGYAELRLTRRNVIHLVFSVTPAGKSMWKWLGIDF